MNQKLFPLLVFSIVQITAGSGLAHSPVHPYRHVVSAPGGDCIFVTNDPYHQIGLRSFATGTCFRITEDQQFEVLWKVDGLYVFGHRLALSRDGSTLIKVVDIADGELEVSSPLVEVYRNGKLERVFPVEFFVDVDPFGSIYYRFLDSRTLHFDTIRLLDGAEVAHYLERLEAKDKIGKIARDKNARYLMINSIDRNRFFINLESGKLVAKIPIKYPALEEILDARPEPPE